MVVIKERSDYSHNCNKLHIIISEAFGEHITTADYISSSPSIDTSSKPFRDQILTLILTLNSQDVMRRLLSNKKPKNS